MLQLLVVLASPDLLVKGVDSVVMSIPLSTCWVGYEGGYMHVSLLIVCFVANMSHGESVCPSQVAHAISPVVCVSVGVLVLPVECMEEAEEGKKAE